MQERLDSFLMYLYHRGYISQTECGPELEFTCKRAIEQGLVTFVKNCYYPNVKTKVHIINL
jgi:hypothetical protein